MRKLILIIVVPMLLLTGRTWGQVETIRNTTALVGKYSIVREWKTGVSIVYTQTSSTKGYFMLEDENSPTTLVADMDTNIRIYDYEIVDKSVYFCGTLEQNGQHFAIVGRFDIGELFYGGGGYDYGIFNNPVSMYGASCQMTCAWRMDAYRYNDTVHIVAVGSADLTSSMETVTITTVIDAINNGTTWTGYMLSNKWYENQYYTDIVATDNYVTAVATYYNNTGHNCFIKTFYKSWNIIYTPVNSNVTKQIVHGVPEGKILVEALGGDTCAVYYHYVYGNEGGSTLKVIEITPTLSTANVLYATHLTQSTDSSVGNAWQLRDIRYNDSSRHLFVLQDMRYPVSSAATNSVVMEYDIANLNCLQVMGSWLYSNGEEPTIYALDQHSGTGYKSVGYDPIRGCLMLYDKEA